MKISLNLIKQFTGVELSRAELLDRIAARLAEVESTTDLAERYEGIVVGEITKASDHPDADKLGVYRVLTGSQTIQVVAGDKTLAAGDKVAYIPPGNIVPSTFESDKPLKLKKLNLRGQQSNGMLASTAELGFNDDHTGVLKLNKKLVAGRSIIDVFELDDTIIEIETKTLTHRPECFGHIGFAREIAGIQGLKFKSPKWLVGTQPRLEHSDTLKLSLKNEVPGLVRRVTLRAFENVEIKPSPLQVQSYLSRLGLKPINNIVDMTNFIMLLTAQPTHAFDYDKVAGHSSGPGAQIVVRQTKSSDTKLKLLDGRTIRPHKDAVLIATDKQALSLGGAMGGSDSEVDASTTKIILEAANFDLYNIRQTSMHHGVFTEAVTRFARGQDPAQCEPVQNYAAGLIEDWSGATPASPLLDDYAKPARRKPRQLSLSSNFINLRLGSDYTAAEMAKTLTNVEIVTAVKADKLSLSVPTWRADMNIAEDVVEEVGRLLGFDNLTVTSPKRSLKAVELSETVRMQTAIRNIMSAAGANEALTYNFVSGDNLKQLGFDTKKAYHIRNSLSPELEYMRPSLLGSLVAKAYPNLRRGYDEFVLYEIGKSHNKVFEKAGLPIEQLSLAAVYTSKDRGQSYFTLATYLRHLLKRGHISNYELKSLDKPALKSTWLEQPAQLLIDGRSAVVELNRLPLAIIGDLKPGVLAGTKLPGGAVLEVDLNVLAEVWQSSPAYSPVSKYPTHEQDITFKVDDALRYGGLNREIVKFLTRHFIVHSIDCLSIYRPTQDKKRNISFRLKLGSDERTLKTSQVNQVLEKLSKHLGKALKAERVV